MDDINDLFQLIVGDVGSVLLPTLYPILPFLLASPLTGSQYRPYGIFLGFTLSFMVFFFFTPILFTGEVKEIIIVRVLGSMYLLYFGIALLSETSSTMLSRFGNAVFAWTPSTLQGLRDGKKERNHIDEFMTGVTHGSFISLTWIAFSGSAFALILSQIIVPREGLPTVLTVLILVLGIAIVFLMIALFLRKIMERVQWLPANNKLAQRIIGGCVVVPAGYLFMVYMQKMITINA